MPIGTIQKYFDYTISLFGLSKSFGKANTRSGFVVANEHIISLLRNHIFYAMDSMSILQASLLSGAFCDSNTRNREYKKYFDYVIEQYVCKRDLAIGIINGLSSIKNSPYIEKITKKLRKILGKELFLKMKNGIPYVEVKIVPQAGFFLLLDFTDLLEHSLIKNEKELLQYMYINYGVKFLVGQSISWPNEKEIIVRITYSLKDRDIIESLKRIYLSVEELCYETN